MMDRNFEFELRELGFQGVIGPPCDFTHHKYPIRILEHSDGRSCLLIEGTNWMNYPTIENVKQQLQKFIDAELKVGDEVEKVGGDYRFRGPIIGIATKKSGKVLYLVEDDRGICHIFSKANIQRV